MTRAMAYEHIVIDEADIPLIEGPTTKVIELVIRQCRLHCPGTVALQTRIGRYPGRAIANKWQAYDNSGLSPELVAKGGKDMTILISKPQVWSSIAG
jgi:hypothetical protein